MNDAGLYAVKSLPKKEYLAPGHRSCPGCGEVLAVRLVHKALGRNTITASATGCMEIVSSPFPLTSWEIPWIHVAFENAAAVAGGIEAALKVLQRKGKIAPKEINVVAMAGDGGTADIGLQALSGALERGHDFLYVCYDNEAYMNTGVQRSSATPFGAHTTTSPAGTAVPGQITWKKNMPEIVAAHKIPYVATATPSYPLDLINKIEKGAAAEGPAYVHILSVCPTGWGIGSAETIKIGRLAVQTGFFPLYEVEDGAYKITVDCAELLPLERYLQPQGRFRHLSEELIAQLRRRVFEQWAELKRRAALSASAAR
ncbi:MAG: pyruvate synthase subunit beta [Firmicutes bacterium]|nr:pyruvate synthase subunit beta [Bacillota bacterium]